MNLTCANCGSKLTYSVGKINISVEPCERCKEDYMSIKETENFDLIGGLDGEKIEKAKERRKKNG